MKIRRTTALIAYWTAALIIVAMILLSLDYSFTEALFMSSLFSPGVVAAKFFSLTSREGRLKQGCHKRCIYFRCYRSDGVFAYCHRSQTIGIYRRTESVVFRYRGRRHPRKPCLCSSDNLIDSGRGASGPTKI